VPYSPAVALDEVGSRRSDALVDSLHWVLARFSPLSLVDILVVTAAFFWFLLLIQGTRADQVFRGIVLLVVVAYLLSAVLNLTLLTWLLQRSVPALLIAIPVIFQPELRRALEQIGRTSRIVQHPLSTLTLPRTGHTVDAIVDACERLAGENIGALIAVERRTGLQDYARTGVRLDSPVSDDFLVYIFTPNAPLHDGAVIVRGDRIVAAGCVLPLSDNFPAGDALGTRHRAALGLSEVTDALAVVVSEETGKISLASNGRLITGMAPERLRHVLNAFYLPQDRHHEHDDEPVTAERV
jgi:diadenylate cyclase